MRFFSIDFTIGFKRLCTSLSLSFRGHLGDDDDNVCTPAALVLAAFRRTRHAGIRGSYASVFALDIVLPRVGELSNHRTQKMHIAGNHAESALETNAGRQGG
jgi:hypothetical protein